jgi:hypothetical protein
MGNVLTAQEVRVLNHWGRNSNAVVNLLRIEARDLDDNPRAYEHNQTDLEFRRRYWTNDAAITDDELERLRLIVRKLALRVPR